MKLEKFKLVAMGVEQLLLIPLQRHVLCIYEKPHAFCGDLGGDLYSILYSILELEGKFHF